MMETRENKDRNGLDFQPREKGRLIGSVVVPMERWKSSWPGLLLRERSSGPALQR